MPPQSRWWTQPAEHGAQRRRSCGRPTGRRSHGRGYMLRERSVLRTVAACAAAILRPCGLLTSGSMTTSKSFDMFGAWRTTTPQRHVGGFVHVAPMLGPRSRAWFKPTPWSPSCSWLHQGPERRRSFDSWHVDSERLDGRPFLPRQLASLLRRRWTWTPMSKSPSDAYSNHQLQAYCSSTHLTNSSFDNTRSNSSFEDSSERSDSKLIRHG